ncbi:hypothetical protein K2173_000305 [Erythroxylum novogranatense]|uniref:DNA topoisomerase n=1 Tax=Erythroxylum novogranatense TaxID=1862640 RepID=A0AAV8SWT7_9ROSI|nr:hypothetical protein K2173_000305 [Erythroxylum novogranatense]
MQRSLLMLPTSSSSSSSAASASASALRLYPFMAKLHYRTLQGQPNCLFPSSSSLTSCHRRVKCPQLKLREVSISHSSVPRRLDAASRSVSILRCLATPGNAMICWSLNDGMASNSVDYVAFAKRHFCQVSSVTRNGGSMVSSGKGSKNAKPLAVRGQDGIANSSTSTLNSVEAVISSDEQMEENVQQESIVSTSVTDVKSNSKPKGRTKKQSKKGKSNKLQPDSITLAADAAAKSSRSTSKSKRATTSRNEQSLTQEKKSTGNTLDEVPNGVSLKEIQTKKRSGKSSKKVRSLESANGSSGKLEPQQIGKLKNVGQGTLKSLYPPTGKAVVVVESATKAKVIQGYLGDRYEVLASYGHVRDLAARSGSVRPNDDFSMVWEVPSAAWTHLKSMKVALSGAENLILASDPDREGEAIAWHIIEMLRQQDALQQDVTVARVVFHEITETSIKNALQSPREIDVNLVHAYLARRALDYLIGFSISPLLWRKLPGCQSAGRVQSAALSLICDREMEIDEFKPQEYWTIEAQLRKKEWSQVVTAHLTHFDSKKLSQFSINSHEMAKVIEEKIDAANFEVVGTKKSKVRKNPPTPYITSTLQQDAANKLHFNSTYTMKLAQKLYEGVQLSEGKATGLITYHRTDGLHISDEAVKDIHTVVIERYGTEFTSGNVRKYFKKVKNAQEAHEAIRPTNIHLLPSMLAKVLDEDALKLYTLIWSRTMACQMEPVMIEQVQVDVGDTGKLIVFRSTSSKVDFLGYQATYEDTEAVAIRTRENELSERQRSFEILNILKSGDPLHLSDVELMQHFTQPPSRYSEGSLVKKLEELGIGRPSTYASTLKVLQDRNYVTVKNRVLYPEFRGRMVSAFLSHHFTEVTEYSFTADMETELDNVSAGSTEWKGLLRDYWERFSSHCKRAESIHIHQVEKMLEKTFGDFLFGSLPDHNRTCPSCMEGTLIFKVSRFGAGYFIGCDQHPKCKYIAKSLYGDEEEEEIPRGHKSVEEPKILGLHPASNEKILLKSGPYGCYVQLGEDRKGYTPKRASVSHIKAVDAITLENAIELLRYPVTLGNHPKDGHPVVIKLARVGFSIRHRRTIASVPKNMKPEDVTMEKALELLSSKNVRQSGRPKREVKVEEAMEATAAAV